MYILNVYIPSGQKYSHSGLLGQAKWLPLGKDADSQIWSLEGNIPKA